MIILTLLLSFMSTLEAREDFTFNQSLQTECSYFLNKLSPAQFRQNTTEAERLKPTKFTKDVIRVSINKDAESLWKEILKLEFKELLNSPYSDFCKSYSPTGIKITKTQKLFRGMKFFANLNFNSPVPIIPSFKSMTAIEISNINPQNKSIEIRYLEGTPTRGWQTIEIFSKGNKSEILHTAYYLGNSPLIHSAYQSVHRTLWEKIYQKTKEELEKK